MDKKIIIDGAVFTSNSDKAIDLIRINMTMEICEASFDGMKFLNAAFYTREVIECSRSMLIDFFENYYFIDDSNYVENKALVGMMEYFKDFDGDIIEYSKELKREKELMGKKGFFADTIRNTIAMKNYYEDDLEELSKNLFFYILTKTNDILYDTSKDYKKFVDSILNLQEYGICTEIDKKYLSRTYNKYKKLVNKNLSQINSFRNMKLDTKISRNTFLVSIDESIKDTLDSYENFNPIIAF
jgi:hypothetical protein